MSTPLALAVAATSSVTPKYLNNFPDIVVKDSYIREII